MEDDEEYSYKAYSQNTEKMMVNATYAEPSEDSDGEKGGRVVYFVEKFSAKATVDRVVRATKIPEWVISYVFSALYAILGITCLILNDHIYSAFAYIVGSSLCLIGVIQFIYALATKEYKQTHTNHTANSLILVALGVMILIEREWAISFIAVGWGIFGLLEGAHAFNHAFSRLARKENAIYYLVKGVIEVVLAFFLLYEPTHHVPMHISVFGVQLIVEAITMLPIVKKLVHKYK